MKIGLDLGTGFVKAVSDYGQVVFPSLYVWRVHGQWTQKNAEAVGTRAQSMLSTTGASAKTPIRRGVPDAGSAKQVEMLLKEAVRQARCLAKAPVDADAPIQTVVGLPYHAFGHRDAVVRMIKRALNVETCMVVAQASGTVVDMGLESAMVVSIGQGTTELAVIDDLEVIDGESSMWASAFVTRKIGKFAHLDTDTLHKNRDTCQKYSRVMAENLAGEIRDMAAQYGNQYKVALSGGGLLIPGMKDALSSGLKDFKIVVPDDPVMSNARGLYKMVE